MRHFVSLGLFIVDEFQYLDDNGNPTGRTLEPQIGGGGTYAAIGARIWLPPHEVGMIVDRGDDFPLEIQSRLDAYGEDMWLFRDNPQRSTTRAANIYRGENRGFNYLTPRQRITPMDLRGTKLEKSINLHFICSPDRANAIISDVHDIADWKPLTIYEPIPVRKIFQNLDGATLSLIPHRIDVSQNNFLLSSEFFLT